MCSEAQAGKAGPLPVALLDHPGVNETKQGDSLAAGGLLLVAASLKLKLTPCLAPESCTQEIILMSW